MKFKTLFIAFSALFAAVSSNAAESVDDPLILVPTIPNNGNPARSPILTPVFYLDGYTLTAADNTLGSTVELIDANDNVVFTTYVSIEGDIQLLTTLSGTYTIEVVRGGITFIGEIEL